MLCLKLRAYEIKLMVVDWVQASQRLRQRPSVRLLVNWNWFPQGSSLGPSFILLFVNDLPDVLEGRVLLFADDTKLLIRVLTSTSCNKFFERPGVGRKLGRSHSTPSNVFTSQLINVLLFHPRCMMMQRSAPQKAQGISKFS